MGLYLIGGSNGASAALHDDFTTKPAGTFPTAAADSSQTWRTTSNPATAPAQLQITGGELTNTISTATAAAGYAEVNLGQTITRIGARFTFHTGGLGTTSDQGSAGIVVWKESLVDNFPTIPNSPCHLAITPTTWTYGVWDRDGGLGLQVLRTGFFEKTLATDGATVHEVDVYLEDDTATVRFPDGTVAVITDSRIRTRAGQYANFEVYQSNASLDTKVGFLDAWADGQTVAPWSLSSGGALRAAASRLDRVASKRVMQTATLTSGTTVTATTTPAIIDANLAVKLPPIPTSGKVLVTLTGWVQGNTDRILLWGLNNGSGLFLAAPVTASSAAGLYTCQLLATGLAAQAGTTPTWSWMHYYAGGTAGSPQLRVESPANYLATIVVESVPV